jgi:hypothetical protein
VARLPLRKAAANAARPLLYASLEFAAHHGATRCFSWFHSRRSAGRLHPSGAVRTAPNMHNSNSRSAIAACTCCSPQLKAKRAAPQ